ncbi:MAG: alcohol dehydrogenase [Bacteroidetes bacterium RBG_13_42_15]|nr:MAG: alcohol dehydrogenase [Bacteroidetes bacterium RBG_13_42_15]
MHIISLYHPIKVTFGNGCIRELKTDLLNTGLKKLFIVTFKEILPLINTLLEDLRDLDIHPEIDLSIRKEPSYNDLTRILDYARTADAGIVIGIGGGSVLDVAKLVAAQLKNNQSLDQIVGINNLKSRDVMLICIPTTSGTGSEVSPNAILMDEREHLKKGFISPWLVPDYVYVDPELTFSVPPAITAATGLDAFTHCLEAYTNNFSHPLVDTFALEGIRLIYNNLLTAVKNGKDSQARANLSLASFYGGMCLGPVNTAAIHALSYPLGSEFDIAHGLSNALLLPYVIEFNLPNAATRYADIGRVMGIQNARSDKIIALECIVKIKKLIRDCGLPGRLSDEGIPEDAINRMAESAMKIQRLLRNNPREITLEDIKGIYLKAF